MECVLEAHPVPDIVWYCSDKEISDNQRTKMTRKAITKDSYVLTLEIQNPTKEDGGNYRCNAINMYGESNANIALNFQGTKLTFLSSIVIYIIVLYKCKHNESVCFFSVGSIRCRNAFAHLLATVM